MGAELFFPTQMSHLITNKKAPLRFTTAERMIFDHKVKQVGRFTFYTRVGRLAE